MLLGITMIPHSYLLSKDIESITILIKIMYHLHIGFISIPLSFLYDENCLSHSLFSQYLGTKFKVTVSLTRKEDLHLN